MSGLDHMFPFFVHEFFGEDKLPGYLAKIQKSTVPSANMVKKQTYYQFMLTLPGFRQEEIEIDIHERFLTVKSLKAFSKDDDSKMVQKEFDFSSFSRSFILPDDINMDEIHATVENGILTITLPRKKGM